MTSADKDQRHHEGGDRRKTASWEQFCIGANRLRLGGDKVKSAKGWSAGISWAFGCDAVSWAGLVAAGVQDVFQGKRTAVRVADAVGNVTGWWDRWRTAQVRFIDSLLWRSSSIDAFSSGVSRFFGARLFDFSDCLELPGSVPESVHSGELPLAGDRNARIDPLPFFAATGNRCGPNAMRPITNTNSSSLKPISNTVIPALLSWLLASSFSLRALLVATICSGKSSVLTVLYRYGIIIAHGTKAFAIDAPRSEPMERGLVPNSSTTITATISLNGCQILIPPHTCSSVMEY